jgi:hypothetical protein
MMSSFTRITIRAGGAFFLFAAMLALIPVAPKVKRDILPQMMAAQAKKLHNATQKLDTIAWGVQGYITWTDPSLNGGQWSYHRLSVIHWSPWRFVEWGWQKTTAGFRGMIAYNDGTRLYNRVVNGLSSATHRYSIQYDPNTGRYWFFVDGVSVWSVDADFSAGDAVTIGGEVATGRECMGDTKSYDLRYLVRKPDGSFAYVPWDGLKPYAVDAPFSNSGDGRSLVFDHGCGQARQMADQDRAGEMGAGLINLLSALRRVLAGQWSGFHILAAVF